MVYTRNTVVNTCLPQGLLKDVKSLILSLTESTCPWELVCTHNLHKYWANVPETQIRGHLLSPKWILEPYITIVSEWWSVGDTVVFFSYEACKAINQIYKTFTAGLRVRWKLLYVLNMCLFLSISIYLLLAGTLNYKNCGLSIMGTDFKNLGTYELEVTVSKGERSSDASLQVEILNYDPPILSME